MTLMTYQRQPVAIACPHRWRLPPHIDRLPDRHALKTFACYLALYARDVDTGALRGDPWRYRPAWGERYAREALIPARAFAARTHRSDHDLATHFGVPFEQIGAPSPCEDRRARPRPPARIGAGSQRRDGGDDRSAWTNGREQGY